MLLFLLLISSGCNVNIPGCGRRSLPFFKPVNSASPSQSSVVPSSPAMPGSAPNANQAPAPAVKAPAPQPTLENSIEMSVSKPKVVPTATLIPTPTATPVDVEKIAYTTLEGGKPTLWVMNPNGTDRIRLTPPGTGSWYPLWSPSGKLLAFLSDMNDGKLNLFVMKKGDKDFQQLTHLDDLTLTNPKGLKAPFSWSPKSDEIAYIYHNQIGKTDLATDSQVTLANFDVAYSISAIEWAPHRDNKYIAFLVKKGADFFSVMLVNPRLKDQLDLADTTDPLADLSWASDASKVAYLSTRNIVYTASAETSLPKKVISNASPEMGPLLSYSPVESTAPLLLTLAKKDPTDDGYRVAWVEKASAADNDPGSLKFLTEPGVVDAIWSPDGSKIAYVTEGELWVMDALTGANKTRIAATGIQYPSWSKK
jgi:Tol biopolymer transport system component